MLVSEGASTLHLRLTNGSTHEMDPKTPDNYQISTFEHTDLPIPLPQAENGKEQEPAPVSQMKTTELWRQAHDRDNSISRWDWIEFHRRFALPTSCLVLALVGIPLGLSSKKGGKSAGFVIAILLVFAYYFVSLVGNIAGTTREGFTRFWGVAGRHRVFFGRGAFVVACRTQAVGYDGVARPSESF